MFRELKLVRRRREHLRGTRVPLRYTFCITQHVMFCCYCPLHTEVSSFVVVLDSHIQRIVLATGETTVIQQVSHRSIKCQSRLWSQRGTKVNGSPHRGDNALLRPTGIQIATKSYATLQAMAPINIKTVHQTCLLHTWCYREQPRSGRIVVAYPRPAFSVVKSWVWEKPRWFSW